MRVGWNIPVIIIAGFALRTTGSASFAQASASDYVIVPGGAAKWVPFDAKNPKGAQISIISGQLNAGPVAFLLKYPKGITAPIHWHTSDYYAVTIEGISKHWLQHQGAGAKPNPPGTVWFQPGGSAETAHGDECVSDSCTAFIYVRANFDLIPVAPAKK